MPAKPEVGLIFSIGPQKKIAFNIKVEYVENLRYDFRLKDGRIRNFNRLWIGTLIVLIILNYRRCRLQNLHRKYLYVVCGDVISSTNANLQVGYKKHCHLVMFYTTS